MITPGIILSIESTGYFRVLMVDRSQDVDYESIIIIIMIIIIIYYYY